MECTVFNEANGKKSELLEELIVAFNGDVESAQKAYAKTRSNSFKKRFGDWESNIRKQMDANNSQELELTGPTHESTGEPKLHKKEKTNQHYFIDSAGDKDFIDKKAFAAFDSNEVEEITKYLAFQYVSNNGARSLNEFEESKLEKDKIMKSIDRSISNYKESIKGTENEKVLLERINLVEKHKDEFRNELVNSISQLGKKFVEVAEEDKGGGVNIKEAFETNAKDTATVNTKIFLSTIESRTVDEATGELVPMKGGFLDTRSFEDFNEVWTTVQNLLVDEVGYGHGQNVNDIYDIMYAKLEDMYSTKYWIDDLLDKLNELPLNKKTEFVQAFTKTKLNYYVTEFNDGGYTVINATSTNSRQSQITSEWSSSFFDSYISSGQLTVAAKESLQELDGSIKRTYSEYSEALESTNSIREEEARIEARDEVIEDAVNNLFEHLETLGVSGVMAFDINTMIQMNGGANKAIDTIEDLFRGVQYMMSDTILSASTKWLNKDGSTLNPFDQENGVKALAHSVGVRKTDIADAGILANNGKMYFSFSNPTYLSNKINEWKKDPTSLEDMANQYNANSRWMNYLLATDATPAKRAHVREQRLDKLQAGLASSFKSKGKNDGVENTKITLGDQINDNITKLLGEKISGKSYFPTIIAADKSRRIEFEGFKMFNSKIDVYNDTLHVGPETVDLFIGYFEDEYNRMKKVSRENKELPEDKKIVHYHGDKGNGLVSQIFPELSHNGTDPKFEELRLMLYKGVNPITDDSLMGFTDKQREVLSEAITVSIKDRLKETVKELDKVAGDLNWSKSSMNQELVKAYKTEEALAGDYLVNGLISSIEYTKLFSGDPAFYKNTADLIKRIPATYTDGLQLRLSDGDSLIFNQATIDGVEVASRYIDKIKSSVTDKSIVEAYERVNTTDAQAWITPRRWKFLKKALGQWGPQHVKVYDKMTTGANMTPAEMKLAAQPLKGVYFEVNEGRPVYLKYSQAVLIPSLVKGTPMQAVYDKMTLNPETGQPWTAQEGHKEVHEVITIDGVKVGAVSPTKINAGATTDIDAEFTLNPVELSNRGWKLQQDLPIKLMHDTNVGSQIQKNILEGISTEGTYNVDGIDIDGSALVQKIHDTVSILSNMGKAELSERFGIDSEGKITDKEPIYQALIEEFRSRDGSENIIAALEKEMPFDAIPQIRGKVESIFMSIMNKALTKISTEGGSFIQVSPFGLETVSGDSDIKIVSKNYNGVGLLPPRIENGKVLPGQAMIPHSQALKIFKAAGLDFRLMTNAEAMAALDPSALELITYRIPNQGMSSNDYLEIVGILPPGVGDSIVVYDGLPAKTGSDFDIDKLFAMQNNVVFNTETNKIEKLSEENKQFAKGNIEKKTAQNDLIASYKAVLNSPLTYDNMMRSIDGAFLKDDITKMFPAPKMRNLELFSPIQQLKTKFEYLSGKFGVAQTANQLVDHVSNQTLDIRLDHWIGVGNSRIEGGRKVTFFDTETTDENSIATSISAFLNAYVDIAKDPYIARGNHNSITANVTFMLLRAGADLQWVNRFIGQPILQELVETMKQSEGITSKKLKISKDIGQKKPIMVTASPLEVVKTKYGFPLGGPKADGNTVAQLSKTKLENQMKGGRDTITDLEILKAFEFLQDEAKKFSEGVMAAKSDTVGAGGSNVERMVNSNKIRKVLEEDHLKGYDSKFQNTMLGTYKENTLDWVGDVVRNSELFFSGLGVVEETFNNVSKIAAKGDYLVSKDFAKSIDNAFYSYMLSQSSLLKDNTRDFKIIMKSTPDTVSKLKKSGFDNFLIEELEIENRAGYAFLGINSKNKPTYYQNKIGRAWLDLYNSDAHRGLAVDLAKYAFTQSGFQNNLNQFFSFIPHEIMKDANISAEVRDMFTNIDEMFYDENFVDQFMRHSSEDPKIVSPVNLNFMEAFTTTQTYVGGSTELKRADAGFIYKPAYTESQELGMVDAKGNRIFPKFVQAKSGEENLLFKKAGTVMRPNTFGDIVPVPVYVRTFKLGLKAGRNRVFEYNKNKQNKPVLKSSIRSNAVPDRSQTAIISNINRLKKNEETFMPEGNTPMTSVQDDINNLNLAQDLVSSSGEVEFDAGAPSTTISLESLKKAMQDLKDKGDLTQEDC